MELHERLAAGRVGVGVHLDADGGVRLAQLRVNLQINRVRAAGRGREQGLLGAVVGLDGHLFLMNGFIIVSVR